LSDTVGFIRDLPHKLVEAFQATLQEAADADLLLHVVDASSPVLNEQRDEVERVLAEIGARDIPQIVVYNKIDRLESPPRSLSDWIERQPGHWVPRVFISAQEGTGLAELRELLVRAASPEGLIAPPLAPTGAAADGSEPPLIPPLPALPSSA
jgi:GTP-binding protein HflX